MFAAEEVLALMQQYYWPFIRISAMFLAAPVFGAASFPVRARILMALSVTALLAPAIPPAPDVDVRSFTGILVAAQQAVIGLAMGFIVQVLFAAAVIAGQSLAMTMGLGFAMSVDPQNGVQVPVLSQFYVGAGGPVCTQRYLSPGQGTARQWNVRQRVVARTASTDRRVVDQYRIRRDHAGCTAAEYFCGGISSHHFRRFRFYVAEHAVSVCTVSGNVRCRARRNVEPGSLVPNTPLPGGDCGRRE